MNRPQIFSRLVAGMALLSIALFWHAESNAGGKAKQENSADKVKAKATASKIGADGKQTVSITLTIEKDWHIYANPVGADDLEAARTRVMVKAKDKVIADIAYPAGTTNSSGTLKYSVYENSVTIPIQVQRTAGDVGPLQLKIQVNACYDVPQKEICLPPGTIELTVQ